MGVMTGVLKKAENGRQQFDGEYLMGLIPNVANFDSEFIGRCRLPTDEDSMVAVMIVPERWYREKAKSLLDSIKEG